MAHALQERYSKLVDEKLRATLVTKDNLIFNNRYEGDPKAGMVKVPVRDTEVEVKKYDRQNGVDISAGSTTYFNLPIDNDEAVNEMIDGFEAAAVPDGIKAERLDSAGYSLGLSMDTKSIRAQLVSPLQPRRLPAPTVPHTRQFWLRNGHSPEWAFRTMDDVG